MAILVTRRVGAADTLHPRYQEVNPSPAYESAGTTKTGAAPTGTAPTGTGERTGTGTAPTEERTDPRIDSTPYGTIEDYLRAMRNIEGWTWNDRQLQALEWNARGHTSFCLHGGGGYGKTEVSVPMIHYTIDHLPATMEHAQWSGFRAGVAVLAYTNTAMENIKNRLRDDAKAHAMTIHKFLGYHPIEVTEVIDGELVTKQKWVYRFHRNNKIVGLHTIYLDEATLPNLELLQALYDACEEGVRIIPIGDLQQQKPPFGQSAMSFLCTRIPNIVLNVPYRQEKESPVTTFLFDYQRGQIGRILPEIEVPDGLTGMDAEVYRMNHPHTPKQIRESYKTFYDKYRKSNEAGELDFTIMPQVDKEILIMYWKKEDWVRKFLKSAKYNVEDSTIIMPYNVGLGTILVNSVINKIHSIDAGEVTHEVYVGFSKHYYACGDIVVHKTKKYKVIAVEPRGGYTGLTYRSPEIGLPRLGERDIEEGIDDDAMEASSANAELYPDVDTYGHDAGQATEDAEGKFLQLSHDIVLENIKTGDVITLNALGDVQDLIGGHAITTYKAQGLQYRNVIGFLHSSHTSLNREMLYTLVTRTEFRVHIVCLPDTIWRSTGRQSLEGNGGEEKIEALRKKPIEWKGGDFRGFLGMSQQIITNHCNSL